MSENMTIFRNVFRFLAIEIFKKKEFTLFWGKSFTKWRKFATQKKNTTSVNI